MGMPRLGAGAARLRARSGVAAPLTGGLLLEQASREAPPLVATALCVAGGLAVYEAAPGELKRQLLQPSKPKAA